MKELEEEYSFIILDQKKSRVKGMLYPLLFVGCYALVFFALIKFNIQNLYLLGICVFGPFIIFIIFESHSKKERLKRKDSLFLTNTGISSRELGVLSWSEIESISQETYGKGNTNYILLKLKNGIKYNFWNLSNKGFSDTSRFFLNLSEMKRDKKINTKVSESTNPFSLIVVVFILSAIIVGAVIGSLK